MTKYEYFQETSESIADNNWKIRLDKHSSQGWELSSVIQQDAYENDLDINTEVKPQETKNNMQTLYLVVFKRTF